MNKFSQHAFKVVGFGVGAALGGPVATLCGGYVAEALHGLLGDIFGSEKDVSQSVGGMLSGLASSFLPDLLRQPEDYPEFNHDFRRGMIDALVKTLREKAPATYARNAVKNEASFKVIQRCLATAADELKRKEEAALDARDHAAFSALFPQGATDQTLLDFQNEAIDDQAASQAFMEQWYDAVLAETIRREHVTDLPHLGGEVEFRKQTIDALRVEFSAAFGQVLKEPKNERLRIAFHRLMLNSLHQGLRRSPQAPAEWTTKLDQFITLYQKDQVLLAVMDGKLDDIKGDTTELLSLVRVLVERSAATPPPPRRYIHVPFASLGRNFVGRETAMAELHRQLRPSGAAQPPIAKAIVNALHGLGGVGKTRLAVEYARTYAEEYSAVLWVSAADPKTLQREMAELSRAHILDLADETETAQQVRYDAVLDWLKQHPGWLLILDNVDTDKAAEAAYQLVNGLLGGAVLLTSRRSVWGGSIDMMKLDVLDKGDAARFLLQRTGQSENATAQAQTDTLALAQELGCLALALEHAAAYISKKRVTLGQYLSTWRQHDQAVQEWHDPQIMSYDRQMATTWEMTREELGIGEMALLRILCWYAPEPVPRWLFETAMAEAIFTQACALVQGTGAPAPATAGTLDESLLRLADYSVITWDQEQQTVQMHRVVQEIQRTRLPEEQRKTSLHHSLQLLLSNYPGDPQDVRTWGKWTSLQPHIEHTAPQAEAAAIPAPTSTLMGNLGLLLHTKALHRQAEDWFRRAMKIDEANYGPNHPLVAIRLNNLAQLLQATNRSGEAEPMIRRALEIGEASYGPDHPKVAAHLNNLALLLKATNRLEEAEQLVRRALLIDETSYGPDHPEVATDLNNLAQLLKDTTRLGEAEPLMRRVVSIFETAYGKDHPNLATALNNLAQLLQTMNRLEDAEPMFRRALKIDEASYGPDHPKVAADLNNLATLLYTTNRLTEAEPLMQRALKIDEASYGPDHPEVGRDLNNLATLLKATNRLEEAEPMYRRALEIDEASFGPDHPEVALHLNNLALLLYATGRLGEAEPLMRRQLEIFVSFVRKSGHEHPHIRQAVENYVGLLARMGLAEDAIVEKLQEIVVEAYGGIRSPAL